ncbi:VPS4-associated protein 1 [Mucidula mucida]|nr:VPS4-associated protein 1 [Mucidula mucida]
MSFTNVYYKRTAATPKACYVCYKPTPIVLATINTVDFLYTCESHLKDRDFASQIQDEQSASPEEIARVKAEWEEKQKRKKEKEQEKAKDKEGDDKDKKDEGDKEKSKSPAPASPPAPSTPTATHQRYALHRDFYASKLRLPHTPGLAIILISSSAPKRTP